MKEELLEKIKKDLEKSGFGSELKACKIFENRNWSASPGSAYYDHEEQKSREIDIVGTFTNSLAIEGGGSIMSEFYLHSEVKKSEKPWVVFKSKPYFLGGTAWDNLINAIHLPIKNKGKLSKYIANNCLLKVNNWTATGIHEAFKSPNNTSKWHGAFISAIKSSLDHYENRSPKGYDDYTNDISKEPTEIYFIQPLIILDGVLMSAELDEKNEIKLEYIQSAAFDFDYRINTKEEEYDSFRVDLVTLDGLEDYLKTVEQRQKDFNLGIAKEAGLIIIDES